jgi:hypothetical protein
VTLPAARTLIRDNLWRVAPSPTQLVWRGRIEGVLRVVAPGLDLLLAAGDRLARAVERDATGGLPPTRPAERLPAVTGSDPA